MTETDNLVVEQPVGTRAPDVPVYAYQAKTRTERVLILGRTRAGQMLCVGGMTDTLANIRLKRDENPPHWYVEACPFHVGDVFTVTCSDSPDHDSPHHREDVRTHVWQYEKTLNSDRVVAAIERTGRVRKGPEPWLAFRKDNNSGVFFTLTEKGSWVIPKSQLARAPWSVAFWRPTVDLSFREKYFWGKSRTREYRIPYVGTDRPEQVLPAGTLVRLSTSAYFKPVNGAALQLSGWFL
ncbi:hypothetical protein KQI52_05050 [bacterium]|nr:hypothetical protein [bacterium]